jgi:hypothetical protein
MTRNINVKFNFKIVECYQRKKSLMIPKGQYETVYRRRTTQWPEGKVEKDKERYRKSLLGSKKPKCDQK